MTPEEVVRSLVEAWRRLEVDEIVDHFTPDAVWHNMPYEPAVGRDAIRAVTQRYVDRATSSDMEIVNIAVNGQVVLTERVDHIALDDRTVDAPAMGTFEIQGDKIVAWRDYFDSKPSS